MVSMNHLISHVHTPFIVHKSQCTDVDRENKPCGKQWNKSSCWIFYRNYSRMLILYSCSLFLVYKVFVMVHTTVYFGYSGMYNLLETVPEL